MILHTLINEDAGAFETALHQRAAKHRMTLVEYIRDLASKIMCVSKIEKLVMAGDVLLKLAQECEQEALIRDISGVDFKFVNWRGRPVRAQSSPTVYYSIAGPRPNARVYYSGPDYALTKLVDVLKSANYTLPEPEKLRAGCVVGLDALCFLLRS
jgi:hypothetical protein